MSDDVVAREVGDRPHEDRAPSQSENRFETLRDEPRREEKPSRPPWRALAVAVVLVAALIGWGVYAHWRTNQQADETQRRTAEYVPTVRVAAAKREDATTVESQKAALETAKAGVGLAEANVKAQQATVARLKALAAFENVTAPFDGVVTARNVEVGDLINADVSTGAPMFTVEEDDLLRVGSRSRSTPLKASTTVWRPRSQRPRRRAGRFTARSRALPWRCSTPPAP
jgi:multidrug efflux pump subunit AcrA (membrane-fusion protein)